MVFSGISAVAISQRTVAFSAISDVSLNSQNSIYINMVPGSYHTNNSEIAPSHIILD
jgi:hypothetical protein